MVTHEGVSEPKAGEPFLEILVQRLDPLIASSAREIRAKLSTYEDVPDDDLYASIQRIHERAIDTLREQELPSANGTSEIGELVPRRVAQGVSIEELIVGHRISMAAIERRLVDTAAELELPLENMFRNSRLLWELSDAFTTRLAVYYQHGWRDESVLTARARGELVRDLLEAPSAEPNVLRRARRFGLDPDRPVVGICAQPPRDGIDAHAAQQRLEQFVRMAFIVGGALDVVDGECVGVLPESPLQPWGLVIGVSDPGPLQEAQALVTAARRVLGAVVSDGVTGTWRLADLTWRTAIEPDGPLEKHLQSRIIVPLAEQGEFGTILIETLAAFLRHDRRITSTADELVVHENTLRHRLARIRDLTGLDLQATDAIVDASWAVAAWSRQRNM